MHCRARSDRPTRSGLALVAPLVPAAAALAHEPLVLVRPARTRSRSGSAGTVSDAGCTSTGVHGLLTRGRARGGRGGSGRSRRRPGAAAEFEERCGVVDLCVVEVKVVCSAHHVRKNERREEGKGRREGELSVRGAESEAAMSEKQRLSLAESLSVQRRKRSYSVRRPRGTTPRTESSSPPPSPSEPRRTASRRAPSPTCCAVATAPAAFSTSAWPSSSCPSCPRPSRGASRASVRARWRPRGPASCACCWRMILRALS